MENRTKNCGEKHAIKHERKHERLHNIHSKAVGDRDPVAACCVGIRQVASVGDHSGEFGGQTSSRVEVVNGSSQCRVFGVSCIFYIYTAVFGTPMHIERFIRWRGNMQ